MASRQLVVQSEESLFCFFLFPCWKKLSLRNHCSLDGKAIRGMVGREEMLPQKQQELRIHVVARRVFFLCIYLFIYFWQPKPKDWQLDESCGAAGQGMWTFIHSPTVAQK